MEVFFFGPNISSLLGVYHPAKANMDRGEGVVLCYPFGQEYMRSHRAFLRLANTLSSKGYHVLRFDYRGTGDSAGDLEDVTPLDWLEDIDLAVQEIRDMAAVEKVTLLGLRMGGLLAGKSAVKLTSVDALVVWDPIVCGGDYLKQLLLDIKAGSSRSNFLAGNGDIHHNGFVMSVAFQRALEDMSLQGEGQLPLSRTLQINSHESGQFDSLKECWAGFQGYEHMLVLAPHDWNYVDSVGGILLPQPVMRAITEWV